MPKPIQADSLSRLDGIAHGFFMRQGGVSQGIYGSLNCGPGSRDDRACVAENRARVAGVLGTAPERLLTCYQVHSADAVVATAPWTFEGMPKADAIVTATPGLAVGALAADCAPVLFADPSARVVAAAHAGWKGALTGIVESTVAAMVKLGARRENIRGVLGPCIGPGAYEVGPEFEARFAEAGIDTVRYFRRPSSDARPYFDLPSFVMDRLRETGIGHLENATACTYADDARFFSYRRTTHRRQEDYGRQISAIVLL